jgi:hypothetical protein
MTIPSDFSFTVPNLSVRNGSLTITGEQISTFTLGALSLARFRLTVVLWGLVAGSSTTQSTAIIAAIQLSASTSLTLGRGMALRATSSIAGPPSAAVTLDACTVYGGARLTGGMAVWGPSVSSSITYFSTLSLRL